MNSSETYAALTARFDKHHKLPKGGTQLDYISTEQCITRLNEVLGVDGWGFEIREHGREQDTLWTLGRLTAYFPERTVVREQFGECATSRGMGEGDARKGAGSDALKKCASLIGVALYLSDKDDHAPAPRQAPPASGAASAGSRANVAPQPVSAPRAAGGPATQPPDEDQAPARSAQATPHAADSVAPEPASRALGTSAPAGGALPFPEQPPEGEPAPITAFFELTRGGWKMDRAATRKQLDPTGLDSDLGDGEAVKAALRRLGIPETTGGLKELFTRSGPTVETRQPVTA